jgi:hypothetical protein
MDRAVESSSWAMPHGHQDMPRLEPMIREEGIGPSLVIRHAPPHRRPFVLLAQDRAQPSPDRLVKSAEQVWSGVFDVAEPPPQHRIEVSNDPEPIRNSVCET